MVCCEFDWGDTQRDAITIREDLEVAVTGDVYDHTIPVAGDHFTYRFLLRKDILQAGGNGGDDIKGCAEVKVKPTADGISNVSLHY